MVSQKQNEKPYLDDKDPSKLKGYNARGISHVTLLKLLASTSGMEAITSGMEARAITMNLDWS